MSVPDTIVAIATPPGQGGIGIVRLSGPRAGAIATAVVGELPAPRRAAARRFRDAAGAPLDAGLVISFPGPHSYTGEDVVELHGHGGPAVLDLVLARLTALGARLARPGEFSQRAFLNGRMDLAQAEAVADLIGAGSAAAARAALNSLEGAFSARVHALEAELASLRVHLEAAIDFPDEDIEPLAGEGVGLRLAALARALGALEREADQGRLLQEGYRLVIAGRPNAGKSSLLNALAGHDAAIVTDIPGTTRDVLRERIAIDGLPFLLEDTAGLREDPDLIEAEGIRRARRAAARAERILYLVDAANRRAVDATAEDLAALPPDVPVTLVYNKIDLAALPAEAAAVAARGVAVLAVSALNGTGLAELRAHLKSVAGWRPAEGGAFSARRRHLDAIARCQAHVAAATQQIGAAAALELTAEELRLAHDALGEITGRVTSEELLGRIFASFCIGK
jgi:tRNA modification GTPase